MIRNDFKTNVLLNNTKGEDTRFYIELSELEKEELILSLQFFGFDFEKFVNSFKNNLFEMQRQNFMKKSSDESLFNILSSSLNLIVSSVEQPIALDRYISILDNNYNNFVNLMYNVDLFIKSFMLALISTFGRNYTERLGSLWLHAVSKFYKSVNIYFKR